MFVRSLSSFIRKMSSRPFVFLVLFLISTIFQNCGKMTSLDLSSLGRENTQSLPNGSDKQ